MPDIELTLAVSYYDHLSDVLRGRVLAEGISLRPIQLPVEEIFFRMIQFNEWDVSEFSFGKYVSLVAAGNPPFRAIPVFPSRVFRQSAIYIGANSGIKDAKDLEGRRVGIPEWAQTAGIYARGYLQHHCGVHLEKICWFQAGVNEPGRKEKVELALPTGVSIEPVNDRSLSDMLTAGELDAVISAREPDAFVKGDRRVERLWADTRAREETYFRETGVFPIMHAIVIKAALMDQYPWIAMNLFKAFEESKANALRHLGRATTSRVPFPWAYNAVMHAKSIFGEDCWPYGMETNRCTLEAFLQYSHEQGVTARKLNIEDLFPPQVQRFSRT